MTAPTITNGRDARILVVSDEHRGFTAGWCTATLGLHLDAVVLDRPPATDVEQRWLDEVVMTRLRPGGRLVIPDRDPEHGPLDENELLFLCQLIGPARGGDVHVMHMHVAEPPVTPHEHVSELHLCEPLARCHACGATTSAEFTTGGTE